MVMRGHVVRHSSTYMYMLLLTFHGNYPGILLATNDFER